MFVAPRNRPDTSDREYFCGLDGDMIVCSTTIFDAMIFETRDEADQAIGFLKDNDLEGFSVSEISGMGVSDNLRGAMA